jgi:hypothetical protein
MPEISLDGVYDLHVHSGPDLFERVGDDVQIATMCRDAGMAGVLFKCHHESTVSRAYYASQMVPGIATFGSIIMNRFVGGIYPLAAEAALRTGAKMVFMPTVDSAYHAEKYGSTGSYGTYQDSALSRRSEGITVLDDRGELIPEVHALLDLVVKYGVAVATAHLSPKELDKFVRAAVDAGCKKVCLTHVNFEKHRLPLEKVKEYVQMGAIAEFCTPSPLGGYFSVEESKEWMEALGSENCYISSDAGSPRKAIPPEAMRVYLWCLAGLGMSTRDLEVMSKENPRRLMEE